jgi:hypothetical protein
MSAKLKYAQTCGKRCLAIPAFMNRSFYYSVLLLIGTSLTNCSGTPFGQNLEQAFGGSQPREERPPRPTPTPLKEEIKRTPVVVPAQGADSETTLLTEKAPSEFRDALEDLMALDVLPGITGDPNQPITRREFARWLVATNNAFFSDQPGRRIREADSRATPAFKDVATTDPDFSAIQGLAEAGIVPSPLNGDLTQTLFKPDGPLTRSDLILWKAPLDSRQPLPQANLNALEATWGFQDAKQIPPTVQRALLSDYQGGEQANLRRVFGFTTLFQPKKPVTQAEAAAALSYFGYQGDGVTARQVLNQPVTPVPQPTSPRSPQPAPNPQVGPQPQTGPNPGPATSPSPRRP